MKTGLVRLTTRVARRLRRVPHAAGTLDLARELFEQGLPYRAIAHKTGVSPATLTRQSRRGGWHRPTSGPPVECYTPEGRRTLRRRALAERLLSLAEHYIDTLEMDPRTTLPALKQAMRLAKAAREMDEGEFAVRVGMKRGRC